MITPKDGITSIIYIATIVPMVLTGAPWQALMTIPFFLWALFGLSRK